MPGVSLGQSTVLPPNANVSQQDHAFLRKAATGDMFEMELGRLAQRNGQKPVVKEFGTWMECDHSLLQQMLRQVAGQVGVAVPRQLNPKDRRQLEELSRLTGDRFDRAYTRHMVKDHGKDIQEFRKKLETAKTQPSRIWRRMGRGFWNGISAGPSWPSKR